MNNVPDDHLRAAYNMAHHLNDGEHEHIDVVGRIFGVRRINHRQIGDFVRVWTGDWRLGLVNNKGALTLTFFEGNRELYEEDMLVLKLAYL